MDQSRFEAVVESVFRAEGLLEAFANSDGDRLSRIMVDSREAKDDTIFALLLLANSALRELAGANRTTVDSARAAVRAWVLAAQVQDDESVSG